MNPRTVPTPKRYVALLCAVVLAALPTLAQTAAPAGSEPAAVSYGAESPGALIEKVRQAAGDEDLAQMAALMAPDDRATLSLTMTMMLGVVIAFSHMGGEMAGGMAEGMTDAMGVEMSPEEKAEAEAERAEAMAQIQELESRYEAILDTYGVNELLRTAPADSDAGEMMKDIDQVALIRDLMQLLDEVPGDETQKPSEQPIAVPEGELTDLVVDGDHASGQLGGETVDFVRIDGRWFMDLGLKEKLQQEMESLPDDDMMDTGSMDAGSMDTGSTDTGSTDDSATDDSATDAGEPAMPEEATEPAGAMPPAAATAPDSGSADSGTADDAAAASQGDGR